MVELPKSRLQRIERNAPVNFYGPGEDAGSWAISYADILMVLLSFFVLFFSFGKQDTESILVRILASENLSTPGSLSQSGKIGNAAVGGAGAGVAVKPKITEAQKRSLFVDIAGLALNSEIKSIESGERLILQLPDNCYRAGSFDLTPEVGLLFDDTITRLRKYQDRIDVTLIGSSDVQVVKDIPSRIIKTNFDLSALRATKALQRTVELGFPLERLQAKGEGQFGRQSRTLSIEIRMREAR